MAIKTTDAALKNCFDKALSTFIQQGKRIKGVHDLLVRGTGANSEAILTKNWSDFDLSVILDRVDVTAFNQVRALYQKIKGEFPYKLSMTTVSRIDYYHPYHHHGIKPLAYNFLLEKASSIFGRTFQWEPPALIVPLQVDSFSHCAYLVHELRNRSLQLNLSSPGEMEIFFPHLLKRTKHFFRDALFLISGYVGEEIPISVFRENFPSIDADFPTKLLAFKKIFLEQEEKVDSLLAAYEVLFDTLSTAYDLLVTHVAKLTTESASQSVSLMA